MLPNPVTFHENKRIVTFKRTAGTKNLLSVTHKERWLAPSQAQPRSRAAKSPHAAFLLRMRLVTCELCEVPGANTGWLSRKADFFL